MRRILYPKHVVTACLLAMTSLCWPVPNSQAAAVYHSCTPVESFAYADRIHVKCAEPVNQTIIYFSAPTSDVNNVARWLSMITTAQAGRKTLLIWTDPADTKGPSFNCGLPNCRPILGLGIIN